MKHFYTNRGVWLLVALFLMQIRVAHAQTQPIINSTLHGVVLDIKTKEALPGAVVKIEGTTHAVATDVNGKFSFITGQKFPYNLIITYTGYKKQELVVNGSPVTILLAEDINQLNDVVVVGYGTKTRKDLISAVSTVKADEVKKTPVASFDAQLQGKAADAVISLLQLQRSKKKLSQAALETLAIIAYKQPVTKTDVEQIRGVNCDYSIQKLLEKELIAITGKSDTVGKPILYGTSNLFMDYFGINNIAELPQLKDVTNNSSAIGQPQE